MKRWLLMFIVADPEIAERSVKGLRAVQVRSKAFAESVPGQIGAIEDDPWERVKPIIEKQSYARKMMNPAALKQFWDFMEAWLNASDKPMLVESRESAQAAG